MAKQKKKPGFLMMHSMFHALDKLPDAELFRDMMRAVCAYSETGDEPDFENPMMQVIFLQIKDSLDMDSERYDEVVEKRRKAAEKRWNASTDAHAQSALQTDAKNAHAQSALQRDANNFFASHLCQPQPQPQPQPHEREIVSLSDARARAEEPEREDETPVAYPSVAEVEAYAQEIGLAVDAQRFVGINRASGWLDGEGRPIRNWKLWLQGYAVRNKAAPDGTDKAGAFLAMAQEGDET